MKYYSLKYKASMSNGFGGYAKRWKITILEKHRGDEGLLEHEKFHVREYWYGFLATVLLFGALGFIFTPYWWFCLPLAFFTADGYRRTKWGRRISEIMVYKRQLKVGYSEGIPYHSPQFAINALMTKYGLGMSEKEARKVFDL